MQFARAGLTRKLSPEQARNHIQVRLIIVRADAVIDQPLVAGLLGPARISSYCRAMAVPLWPPMWTQPISRPSKPHSRAEAFRLFRGCGGTRPR